LISVISNKVKIC